MECVAFELEISIIIRTAFSSRRSSITLAEENPDEKNRKRKKKMALMEQERAKEKTNVKGPQKKSVKRSWFSKKEKIHAIRHKERL